MLKTIKLSDEQIGKLKTISSKIKNIYNGMECENRNAGCLNTLRQALEYICFFTCDVHDIKITRKTKKGKIVENDNPTLGDMAPLIEKHFKENDILWSKEVGMHIGSVWILGNLGSHAQKDQFEGDTDLNKATVANALNSMYIVTDWFYRYFGQECPIAPKGNSTETEEEKELTNKINGLYEKLAVLKLKVQDSEAQQENNINIEEAEDKFSDIYFDDLIEAIELGQCILFVGPGLSTDENGDSLHENFFKKISRRKIEYNQEDGFFMPKTEKQIEVKAMNFYGNQFEEQNKTGRKILETIAQVPFSLIVSVTPDETMHSIYSDFNKKHEFIYYKPKTKHDIEEPTLKKPVIFNMLGNCAKDGKYIFTHKQFYDYVNKNQQVKIPFEIETKIKDTAHYLFLGIDFNKWDNRLLLFALNLYENAEAFGFSSKKPEDIHSNFVMEQFNISFIDEKYEEFVNLLVAKCEEKNINKKLLETFIETTTEDISKISINQPDKAKELIEIINEKIELIKSN